MRRRRTVLLLFLLGAAPLLLGTCLLLGPAGPGFPDLNTAAGRAVFALRVHRLTTGFFVGAALSCAGVVFQALLRNPLAEPYILGVSSGAGLGAALAIVGGLTAVSPFTLPLIAFLAAAATLTVVFALGSDGGSPSIYGLILSGVIVSAVCSSLLMFIVATAPAEGLHSILWWMLGNLQPASGALLGVSALLIGAGILAAWAIGPELNALTLGRAAAHHIGIRTRAILLAGLALATLVTAVAVGLAGLIGFVGLIVPHVARALFGPDHRRLIPASAVAGGVFLALCDAAARTIMAPIEIPVGVVTALCGGPFFLLILRRRKQHRWIE
jgi:iron complex transport system permease protein